MRAHILLTNEQRRKEGVRRGGERRERERPAGRAGEGEGSEKEKERGSERPKIKNGERLKTPKIKNGERARGREGGRESE